MMLVPLGLCSGIALGSNNCGIRGVLQSCYDRAKQIAARTEHLADVTESPAQDILKSRSDVNDKFFMFTTGLAALKTVQEEILDIQNSGWKIIQEHFENFNVAFIFSKTTTSCFFRQQIIFIYGTLSSLLSNKFANIKSYRSPMTHTEPT